MPWARYGVERGRCACSELTGAASQLPPPITEKQALARDRGGPQIPGGGSNCWKAWLGPRPLGWGGVPPKRRAAVGMAAPRAEAGNALGRAATLPPFQLCLHPGPQFHPRRDGGLEWRRDREGEKPHPIGAASPLLAPGGEGGGFHFQAG